jgi:DNA repair protein RecN (Recombination protein N)
MLKRLTLRDFVIVPQLELEWSAGFSVLTGETGAGKSILLDALQLAAGRPRRRRRGARGRGARRAGGRVRHPARPAAWLDEAGFEPGETLLLRRAIDAQGKSRAWINGSPPPWRNCARPPSAWSTSTASTPGKA